MHWSNLQTFDKLFLEFTTHHISIYHFSFSSNFYLLSTSPESCQSYITLFKVTKDAKKLMKKKTIIKLILELWHQIMREM